MCSRGKSYMEIDRQVLGIRKTTGLKGIGSGKKDDE